MAIGAEQPPEAFTNVLPKRAAFAHAAAGIDDRNGIAANHKADIGDGPLILRVHQLVDAEVNVNAWRHLTDWEWIDAFPRIGRRGERRDRKGCANPCRRIEAAQKGHRGTFALCRCAVSTGSERSKSLIAAASNCEAVCRHVASGKDREYQL